MAINSAAQLLRNDVVAVQPALAALQHALQLSLEEFQPDHLIVLATREELALRKCRAL